MFLFLLGASSAPGGGAILRELYTGIGGGSVYDLTNSAKYIAGAPDATNWITDLFEAPTMIGDDYGQRVHGCVIPPETGYYTFWIAADDQSSLRLSTNSSRQYLAEIASTTSWTWPREWTKETNQQSSSIYLEAGRLYYIEALAKEGAGNDCLAVRWRLPNGSIEEPVYAVHLVPPGGPFQPPAPAVESTNWLVVTEGEPADFWVSVSNLYPVAYQWQRDATNIVGASSSNYVIPQVSLADSNVPFRCILSNSLGVVTSVVKTLVVLADLQPPALSSVYNVGSNQVRIVFSEAVESNSSQLAANYTLSGVGILSAAAGGDTRTIILNVPALTNGVVYTLTVSNVLDRSAAANRIADGTQWVFTARPFALTDIGGPLIGGSASYVSNGLDITSGGTGSEGTSDQLSFSYTRKTGNFDVKVRLDSLDGEDPWATAGLMARETLSTNSRYAAMLATPGMAGAFLEYRSSIQLLDNADLELSSGSAGHGWWYVHDCEWKGDWGWQHSGTGMVLVYNWGSNLQAFFGQTRTNIVSGRSYTFSLWGKKMEEFAVGSTYLYIRFKNSSSAIVGMYTNQVKDKLTAAWQKFSVQAVAPAGAVSAEVGVDVWSIVPGGSYMAWDDASLHPDPGLPGESVRVGHYPSAYPNLWLRLQRTGDVFAGYASMDGGLWTRLGDVRMSLSNTLYLGMTAASHDASDTATASFRDWSDTVVGGMTGSVREAVRPPGPSSRCTALSISEILYNPPEREDGRDLEFIELYNSGLLDIDLAGYRLTGSIGWDFPADTILRAGGYLVVANNPADVEAVYGLEDVQGGYSDKLPNDSGVIRLRDPLDSLLLEVEYKDRDEWPVAADVGHSLVLADPERGEADVQAWAPSRRLGGSPGWAEPVETSPHDAILINEVLTHTDLPQEDFVELYNHGTQAVDLAGCRIRPNVETNEYVIPGGTTIPARGFRAFTQSQMGFLLQKEEERIVLVDPAETRVIDAVRVGAQSNGVPLGRFPSGAPGLHELAAATPGTNNAPLWIRDVVINEIMYHPMSEDDADEYVELHNRGSTPVNLSGWSFVDGVEFTFPTNARIAPSGYVVVARSATNLMAAYAALQPTNTFGDYSGSLSDRGERIALAMLEDPADPAGGWVIVDEVAYTESDDWGRWADGEGSSLELKDPRSDNRLAANWAGSDETAKASWTHFAVTGTVDNGMGPIQEAHVLLLGEGECLLDDLDIRRSAWNRVTNGYFEGGTDGWLMQGNHVRTGLETNDGYASSKSLRIRASDGGDTGANRIETTLGSAFSWGDPVEFSGYTRWLCGHPRLLVRLGGNYAEASVQLDVPENLGTPGARNSRALTNAPPAIWDVAHAPLLPAANEIATITARVHDPDGIQAVVLQYRIDPSSISNTITMRDDGAAGDAVAGDGVYSAALPAQSNTALVAFHVWARDSNAVPAVAAYPENAPARECLVRFGETDASSSLGAYHVWLTQTNMNLWRTREELSNEPLDATFVCGGSVIYNAGIRYRGSPFIRPIFDSPLGSLNALVVEFPRGSHFLGANKLNLDTLEPGRDNTLQREQTAFSIGGGMGLHVSHQRYVRVYLNGSQRGEVYADSQHVNSDYVRCHFPDDERGEIFKIDDWFEFTNTTFGTWLNTEASLESFTSGGQKKQARYRWNWEKKSNQGLDDNYTNVFALVDAMNETNAARYLAGVRALVDAEQWMTAFALRHVLGDWDGYGYARGKNMFAYRPVDGRWAMVLWDFDFSMGVSSRNTDTDPFDEIKDNVLSNRFFQAAAFRRAYWQAIHTAVDGPLLPSACEPGIDARHEALADEGINAYSPDGIKSWLGLRRNYLATRLLSVDPAFAITSNGGAGFSTNRNEVLLQGVAPIEARLILVNGVPYIPEWSTVTGWVVRVVLQSGANTLTVQGADSQGNPVGDADTITITYTGTTGPASGALVLNEIMYNPTNPGASFVEIHNLSTNCSYDLFDYELSGVDLVFTQSAVVAPQGYLVVAANPRDFAAAYGADIQAASAFAGLLENGGETLRLVQLNGTNADVEIDVVTYDDDPPWPGEADGYGPSLQLVDAREDNDRVGNWAVGSGAGLYTPGASNSVCADLPSFPSLWLNEAQPDNETGITNRNGERESWFELYNSGASGVGLTGYYLTDSYSNLVKCAVSNITVSAGEYLLVWADEEPELTTGREFHVSFELSETNGSLALVHSNASRLIIVDYLNYPVVAVDRSYGSYPNGDPKSRQVFHYPTPGASNIHAGAPVSVTINEWMADNSSAYLDEFGENDDWFELHNAGPAAVDLSGYTLTDDLSNPAKWTIPGGVTIAAGGFLLVWADEDSLQNGGTNTLHAGFKLGAGGEEIGLYTPERTLVDAIAFGQQTTDVSQGRWPDSGAEPFFYMPLYTPWQANVLSTNNSAPVLNSVGDRAGVEESLLSFAVTAVDTDVPLQALTFSLDAGAPAGAAINPTNGWFTWTPSEAQGPCTNEVTIRVTDNGWSNRSDTETISIAVAESNRPPVVNGLPDICLGPGNFVVLAVGASDPDIPANGLAFSLDPGAPAGAEIGVADGVFAWTPSEADASTTNGIVIRVTDDGSPSLSGTNILVLVVTTAAEALAGGALGPVATGMELAWGTQSGTTYRVQYVDDLNSGLWAVMGGDVVSTNVVMSVVDPAVDIPRRYYRILQVLP